MMVKPFPASGPDVVAVIGGGFSGTMVAVNLAREAAGRPLHIVLFERGERVAKGVAYGTRCPEHLLNVPAGLMSALVDEPGHFLHWLQSRDALAEAGTFAPRMLYGEYLEELLAGAAACDGTTIELVRDEIHDLRPGGTGAGLIVSGREGVSLRADRVVLALGNPKPRDVLPCPDQLKASRRYVSNSWDEGVLDGLGREDRIVLIGSGLSAVDQIVAARAKGLTGPITVISRHGLFPQRHRTVAPRPVEPLPTAGKLTPSDVLRHLRRESARCEREGSDWRLAVDALRPSISRIWRGFSLAEKERFIRHLGSRWDVHRHRVAPDIDRRLDDARRDGQLRVIAGRVRSISARGDEVELSLTRRGGAEVETLRAHRVINCTGPSRCLDPGQSPLVDALLGRGLGRSDPLGLGLEVADTGALITADGSTSERIFALGPILKGQLWETTAVRELRVQAHDLARLLLALESASTARKAGTPPRDRTRPGGLNSLEKSA
jgi:uncharacterized NAD(P)/FAD-binding protein YdhS